MNSLIRYVLFILLILSQSSSLSSQSDQIVYGDYTGFEIIANENSYLEFGCIESNSVLFYEEDGIDIISSKLTLG